MNLFRIHINPTGGMASRKTTFKYCQDNNLLGVGWRTNSHLNTKDWDKYYKEASKKHSNLNICAYIEKTVCIDDLVWTRDQNGEYYLARITSGWEYFETPESKEKDIDIANIFRVIFLKKEIDAVPGKVVACFRASRTIQAIHNKQALEYSKYLWNKHSGEQIYEVDNSKFSDIFMMLSEEETEDLVFLYLQSKGWYVVPNSRKVDTMSFEYLAVHPKSGKRALTQVKTGYSEINPDDYKHRKEQIFLFQSNGKYSNRNSHKNVKCITRVELLKFLDDSIEWLPAVFKNKKEIVD